MKTHRTKCLEKKKALVNKCFAALIIAVFFFKGPTSIPAQSQRTQNKSKSAAQRELDGGFFKIKIPLGFVQDQVDEPGIYKWRKDSGEIYIVSGDSFFQAQDSMFQNLHDSAKKDARIEEAKILKIKGGKALLCKEKGSTKPNGLRTWRLIVFTNKKMLNIDFTAPTQDFTSFVPAFEDALRSLKLASQS